MNDLQARARELASGAREAIEPRRRAALEWAEARQRELADAVERLGSPQTRERLGERVGERVGDTLHSGQQIMGTVAQTVQGIVTQMEHEIGQRLNKRRIAPPQPDDRPSPIADPHAFEAAPLNRESADSAGPGTATEPADASAEPARTPPGPAGASAAADSPDVVDLFEVGGASQPDVLSRGEEPALSEDAETGTADRSTAGGPSEEASQETPPPASATTAHPAAADEQPSTQSNADQQTSDATPAKKAAAKKTTKKTATKKAATPKTAAKKTTKAPAKKAATKKSAATKSTKQTAATKKTAAKKTTVKKAASDEPATDETSPTEAGDTAGQGSTSNDKEFSAGSNTAPNAGSNTGARQSDQP